MIRINLLPLEKRKRKKKPKPVPGFVVACVVLLAVSAAASYYASYYFKSKVAALEETKKQNNEKLTQLDERIKEVKNFEALNKTFTERKTVIEQLRKNQGIPVKILAEMASRLTEGVWITSMSISGDTIDIAGVGFTNPEIVSFVQSLKASPLFREVYLHGTKQSKIESIETFTFTITLQTAV